jgi:phosphoglycolate phosphatase-like HAD superfamily hydrolase
MLPAHEGRVYYGVVSGGESFPRRGSWNDSGPYLRSPHGLMLSVSCDTAVVSTPPLGPYRQLVFDCDGVLFDSNTLKESNIREATAGLHDTAITDRFVEYFVRNNGLPREAKIAWFFHDPADQRELLGRYNHLNTTTIPFLKPDPAARAFVEHAAAGGTPLYVLSGGDETEVRTLLANAGMAPHFREILGGPISKASHLERLALSGPTCYFGDSLHDYEVAQQFGFDFIFLSRYTQFWEWEAFFGARPEVAVAYDFRSLSALIPCSA